MGPTQTLHEHMQIYKHWIKFHGDFKTHDFRWNNHACAEVGRFKFTIGMAMQVLRSELLHFFSPHFWTGPIKKPYLMYKRYILQYLVSLQSNDKSLDVHDLPMDIVRLKAACIRFPAAQKPQAWGAASLWIVLPHRCTHMTWGLCRPRTG